MILSRQDFQEQKENKNKIALLLQDVSFSSWIV